MARDTDRPAGAIVTADNIVTVDLLNNGSAWVGSNRVSAPSATPERSCARTLRDLGASLDTIVRFRRMGQIVRQSTMSFLLRDHRAVTP
jgi:hypothetical protein